MTHENPYDESCKGCGGSLKKAGTLCNDCQTVDMTLKEFVVRPFPHQNDRVGHVVWHEEFDCLLSQSLSEAERRGMEKGLRKALECVPEESKPPYEDGWESFHRGINQALVEYHRAIKKEIENLTKQI
jgi:hypothetical protein